ncbi:MAG: hypothetical protein H6737_02290 [Alphaproteobacteria bacterium]|nr:hypothetical protein [Alphaproteobacteria bacterium]
MTQGTKGRGGKAGGKAGKRALGDGARKQIADAHALEEAGKHADAAQAFAQLGEIAAERGQHAIGAYLALRGASALLRSGDAAAAVEAARAGIAHAEGISEKKRVGRHFGRFVRDLRSEDADVATALSDEVKTRFGLKTLPTPGDGVAPNRAQRRSLPKACAGCGTPLDAATIRFEDDGTVDCPACGHPLS